MVLGGRLIASVENVRTRVKTLTLDGGWALTSRPLQAE
jgi:hypothetical protein